MSDKAIALVWLKRDLRLRDHAPLVAAAQTGLPVLCLYLVEDIQLKDPHMDIRHWRFIWQSIQDLQHQLAVFDTRVKVARTDIFSALEQLQQHYPQIHIFSHEEVGLAHTFDRDTQLQHWCQQRAINWQQFATGAVQRGLQQRQDWDIHWQQIMKSPCQDPQLEQINWLNCDSINTLFPDRFLPPVNWQKPVKSFQQGGEKRAWFTLKHFFQHRGKDYAFCISNPEASRKACSRLSPYLAWGNISLRQMYQFVLRHWHTPGWRASLRALCSRLHWHCHFIQKFESGCHMQFQPLNPGYLNYPYQAELAYLRAWKQAKTGYPMVDACMRALYHTGYINFRMRAMLVSFLCHHLNQDWRQGVVHLARLFLDFEPGIHYPQFQMQAGITGFNTIRIYNPVKQSLEHDAEGTFLRKWLPELAALPTTLLHHPWKLTLMEQQMYGVELGKDYPYPIIELEDAARQARDRLWAYRKLPKVKRHNKQLLFRHSRPSPEKQSND